MEEFYVGWVWKSQNGNFINIGLDYKIIQNVKPRKIDGKEYMRFIVHLNQLQETIDGKRQVANLCQLLERPNASFSLKRKMKALEQKMSFVKAAIIKDKELDVIEVHGAELFMSSKKRIENDIELANKLYKDDPDRLEKKLSWLNECLEFPRSHNSGVIRGRAKLKIAELDTEKQLDRWVKYLQDNDIPCWAADNMGYPYNSIINFDNKTFNSMKNNWYAHYEGFLPDNWNYKELSIAEMRELADKYSMSDRHKGVAMSLLEEMIQEGKEYNKPHIEAIKREYDL